MADPFIIDLFLDNENAATINQAVTGVVLALKEESDSTLEYNNLMKNELGSKHINEDVFERIVRKCSDREYREYFKMSRATMAKLIEYLKEKCNADISRMIIPFEKKVHILLYALGSTSSLNEAARVLGIHKSSTSIIFRDMCALVTECRYDLIKWPNFEEQDLIKRKVNTFPNCVGFIDTCKFQIKTPGNNPANLRANENPDYIYLQAVCDNTLKFTDIYLGDTTVTSKSVLFEDSPLCDQLGNLVSFENHILGDMYYPLTINVMTPFKRSTLKTKKIYNRAHHLARMAIRRALGRLKAKFRRLKHLDVKKSETATIIICAACVLHNFILLHEPDDENNTTVTDDGQSALHFVTDEELNAVNKRILLCNYINSCANV